MESRGKEEKRQGTEEEMHVADEELSLYHSEYQSFLPFVKYS